VAVLPGRVSRTGSRTLTLYFNRAHRLELQSPHIERGCSVTGFVTFLV